MSRTKFDSTVATLVSLVALPLFAGLATTLGLDSAAAVLAAIVSSAAVGVLGGAALNVAADEMHLAPGRLAVAENSGLFCK